MLNIRDRKGPPPEAHDARPAIYLNDFPAYASPPEIEGPIYKLTGDESEQASAIDLLQLAFVRVLGRSVDPSSPEVERRALDARLKSGREQLMLALATRQKTWKGAFERWVGSLKEEDYQLLRAHALFEVDKDNSYPLWLMGFWNLIAEVLSHEAITKLRVQGHFGHTIEENPNAVELSAALARLILTWLNGGAHTDALRSGLTGHRNSHSKMPSG
jgi:hypothetical protein